jgi:hypothetical protein
MSRKRLTSRKDDSHRVLPEDRRQLAPDAEHQIQTFVDSLLVNEGTRRLILEGLKNPAMLREIAKRHGFPFPNDPGSRLRFKRAIEKKDRRTLLSIIRKDWPNDPIPHGKENLINDVQSKVLTPTILRKALISVADTLKQDRPGPPARIPPGSYAQLADKADSLFPVILKLLQNYPRSGRTLEEHLDFMKSQHADACTFLATHVEQLKKLLGGEQLPKPAKKIKTKAHVIADSLAGCDYGLSFSTSIERVSQGRRERERSKPSDPDSAN